MREREIRGQADSRQTLRIARTVRIHAAAARDGQRQIFRRADAEEAVLSGATVGGAAALTRNAEVGDADLGGAAVSIILTLGGEPWNPRHADPGDAAPKEAAAVAAGATFWEVDREIEGYTEASNTRVSRGAVRPTAALPWDAEVQHALLALAAIGVCVASIGDR